MATKSRGRPRKISGPVHDRYRELEARGWSAAAISRKLQDEFPDEAPADERTIQRYVREDRSLDTSESWRLSMSDPEEWPSIFEVLATVRRVSNNNDRWLTASEARWIARILRANQARGYSGDPFGVFLWAQVLARGEASDNHSSDSVYAVSTGLLPLADGA